MNGQEEDSKIYTVREKTTGQDFSFCVPRDCEPPPKIRFHDGSSSIAVFSFEKKTDSYTELSNDELETFDEAFKSGGYRSSHNVSRERGDERFDKQLAKLQKRLKQRNNEDQFSHDQQFAEVLHVEIKPSKSVTAEKNIQLQADDLKVSKPQVISIGPTSAEICWKESVANNEHLANCTFELEMSKSKNTSFLNVYSGPEQSFAKTDLLPGSKYYFRLCAIKDGIKGPFSPDVFIVKDPTAPCIPDIPHISSKTKNSLVIKWTIKSDNGSPVTSYVLQWNKEETNGQFETIYTGSEKQFKCKDSLSKFPPKTTCRFRVKAINKIGESEFSSEFHYTSSAGVPSAPDSPSLVQATDNSLQLSWKKPNTNGAEITEYILQMDDEYQGYGFLPVYRGLEQNCVVTDNLKRNTSYKFRLSAINVEGESKWSDTVSFSTKCQAPGRMLPPILDGKVHTKSFMVSWVAPSDDGGSEIVSFSLEVNNGKGGSFQELYKGADTCVKVQDLLPGHLYKVRVSCSSSEFKSPWSEVTNIKTLPVIPDPPSAPRQAKNCKPQGYAIELEWDAPSCDGGSKITNYNVQMKGAVEEDFRHIYLGSKTCCCAADLQPNCKYTFRVRAHNIAGESKFSEISCLSTGPGPPDTVKQLNVACRSSSAIQISWKVPKTNGSPVTSYVLQCAKDPNGPFEKVYAGTTDMFEMKKNISPSTMYYFRVQACSAAGCTDWSNVSSCKTFAGPPAQVNVINLIDQSETSLTVEWKKPYNNGAAILSYNIDISGRKMLSYVPGMSESSSEGDTLTYTIADLQPNTQYRLRVQGVNKAGCGVFSSNITGTTGKIPPHAPVLSIQSDCSYQSVKLRWSFLRSQSEASDLTYELQMKSTGTSFETVFKGSTTAHKVTKLQEQTMYSFRIRAANEAGYGPYSEISSCTTATQPPAIIKGLSYSNLSTSAVTLSWKNVPLIRPADQITYIVYGREKEKKDFKQLYEGKGTSFTYSNVSPGKSYCFQVCAVRTLANNEKIQSSLSPVLSLTTPSEITRMESNPLEDQVAGESDSQPKELSEKQLAGIFFVVFAFVVLLISLVVSFLFS